jgi:hypothetical protein
MIGVTRPCGRLSTSSATPIPRHTPLPRIT